MSKVDWSKRHDSTHVDPNTHCFYKQVGGKWMLHLSGERFTSSSSLYNGEADERNLIERPQPKPWSGPEDGLPPVNTVCEYMWNYKREGSEYVSARVLHNDNGSLIVRILDGEGKGSLKENRGGDCGGHPIFRPIKTAEPIAAEKRETAIREFMDVVGIDCRVTASKAVDAGFKKPSKSESRDDAVDAMELIVPHIGSVAAGKLYDAGFKREVV